MANAYSPRNLEGRPRVGALIVDLTSDDGWVRQKARRTLVETGPGAVPQLIDALFNPDERLRLEAERVLREIADPRAASALVIQLEDPDSGTRWLAAEGLIALGRDAVAPLLHALSARADSILLRDGAQRILRALAERKALHRILLPVLSALQAVEPAVVVPAAVHAALDQLGKPALSAQAADAAADLLVREWMTPHPFTIGSKTTLPEASHLMLVHHIRRLPVLEHGRLAGIVTLGDLRGARPSGATTLSIFELNYRLAMLTVDQIMSRQVVVVSPDATLVAAARLMLENKIGGLPVVEHERVAGIITESDIFRAIIRQSERSGLAGAT